MAKVKTHYEDCDVLVVGGGMAGTGGNWSSWFCCLGSSYVYSWSEH